MSTISASTTSTTAYKVTADTTGTLVLQTGATPTTAMTIDASQNITTANRFAKASMPTGTVLQVLSTTKTNVFSSTSTSFVDITGLSVTITPTSTSSTILILVTSNFACSAAGIPQSFNLVRNSTNIAQPSTTPTYNGTVTPYLNLFENSLGWSINFLDSPATTSATTYKIQGKTSGGTFYVNGRGSADFASISTITVMEIAA
jgi:hypothetical protein